MQNKSQPHIFDGFRARATAVKCVAANDPRELSAADKALAESFAGSSPFSLERLYDGSPESEALQREIDAGMDKRRAELRGGL